MKFKLKKRKSLRPVSGTGKYIEWLLKTEPQTGKMYELFVLVATMARDVSGLTQAQLADMVGTTEQSIIDFEAGDAPPESDRVYERLKQVLMIRFGSVDDLPADLCGGAAIEFRLEGS